VRPRAFTPHTVIPAQAGIHIPLTNRLLPHPSGLWIPACAGMTRKTNPIRHPSESWDLRRGRTTSHPYIVIPDPSTGSGQA